MSELEQIVKVVRRHHLMTLATTSGLGVPWVAHAFYAWAPELESFVFTTDPATRHGSEMIAGAALAGDSGLVGARVAAGIALETRIVGRVQGIQIEGVARQIRNADSGPGDAESPIVAGGSTYAVARRAYLRRFPYAAAMELRFWLLTPTTMKLTDNTLGFGTKIVWEKD